MFLKGSVLPISKSQYCYCSVKAQSNKEYVKRHDDILGHMQSCQTKPRPLRDIEAYNDHLRTSIFKEEKTIDYIDDVYCMEKFAEKVLRKIQLTDYSVTKCGHLVAFIYHQLWVKEAVTTLNVFNKQYDENIRNPHKDDLSYKFDSRMLKISNYFPKDITKYRKMYYAEVIEEFRKFKVVEKMAHKK